MIKNTELASAYNTFTEVLDVIDMITDNVYLSVTDFSRLMTCLTGGYEIEATIINNFLLQKHLIRKQSRRKYKQAIKEKKRPLKYIPSKKSKTYCKVKTCATYSFLLWDFRFIFYMFNINFSNTITDSNINEFCTLLAEVTGAPLNVNTVNKRLKQLQMLLSYESICS